MSLSALDMYRRRRSHRILTREDYSRVYREGRRYSGGLLTLYFRPTGCPPRLGVTSGRRLKGAVQRNRAKRRVREAFRRLTGRLCAQGDIVLVARPGAATAGFSEIVAEMESLCTAGQIVRGRG